MNPVRTVLHRALLNNRPLNILCAPFDGRFENMLASLGHNIYIPADVPKNQWDVTMNPPAKGVFLLHHNLNVLPVNIDFDVFITNDKINMHNQNMQIKHTFHLPMIVVEHFLAKGHMHEEDKDVIKNANQDNTHVATLQCIADYWGLNEDVIEYGIDLDELNKPEPRQQRTLIVGDFMQQDYGLLHQILQNIGNYLLIGNNQGLSQTTPRPQLIELYNKCDIYLNLCTKPHIPIQLLEAMGAGCTIVTNNNPIINNTLLNEDNAFVCRSLDDFRYATVKIRGDQELREKYGAAAKATVAERFSLERFKTKWNKLLSTVTEQVYIRG